jgi:hypothetical protein
MSDTKACKTYFGGASRPSLYLNMALVWWLALDHFHAPGWLYGVAGTLYACFVAAFIAWIVTDTKEITAADVERRLERLEKFAKARTPRDDVAMWS